MGADDEFVPSTRHLLSDSFFRIYQRCLQRLADHYFATHRFDRSRLATPRSLWKKQVQDGLARGEFELNHPLSWTILLQTFAPFLCGCGCATFEAPIDLNRPGGDLLNQYPTEFAALQYLYEMHIRMWIATTTVGQAPNVELLNRAFVLRSNPRLSIALEQVAADRQAASGYAAMLGLKT